MQLNYIFDNTPKAVCLSEIEPMLQEFDTKLIMKVNRYS